MLELSQSRDISVLESRAHFDSFDHKWSQRTLKTNVRSKRLFIHLKKQSPMFSIASNPLKDNIISESVQI